jgi:hypothetical protein
MMTVALRLDRRRCKNRFHELVIMYGWVEGSACIWRWSLAVLANSWLLSTESLSGSLRYLTTQDRLQ